jgi:hypothetical protein
MKTKSVALAIVLVLVLVNMSGAASSTQYAVDWDHAGTGGASMSSSTYRLSGTAAQPVTGISTSSTYSLCTGYWCGTDAHYPIYLPVILCDF